VNLQDALLEVAIQTFVMRPIQQLRVLLSAAACLCASGICVELHGGSTVLGQLVVH
jgi:hypothetical protein